MRVFFGVCLPKSVKDELMTINVPIEGIHWQSGRELHVTVCYVGEVSAQEVERIRSSLKEIAIPSFEVSIMGVGVFGAEGSIGHLWAGLEPWGELDALHNFVGRRLADMNVSISHLRYHPHITLARFSNERSKSLGTILEKNRDRCFQSFKVTEVVLFKSIPGKFRSTYQRLSTMPLIGDA
uniref:RNA 2',3'-cyclic phosphodiesterase n=1 Tax=Marinobacter nauticus TaxID=2743 RepID=A0A455W6T1_MARNT|nr:RNA 2',3'-cyclic phosphodiesterase [Marinobacter nauticus]